MRACPVQAFTDEVERALSLFDRTYESRVISLGLGAMVVYERAGFPRDGSLAVQDARDIEALRELQGTFNAIAAEHQARGRKRDGAKGKDKGRVRPGHRHPDTRQEPD